MACAVHAADVDAAGRTRGARKASSASAGGRAVRAKVAVRARAARVARHRPRRGGVKAGWARYAALVRVDVGVEADRTVVALSGERCTDLSTVGTRFAPRPIGRRACAFGTLIALDTSGKA